jgi:hypothetical protein
VRGHGGPAVLAPDPGTCFYLCSTIAVVLAKLEEASKSWYIYQDEIELFDSNLVTSLRSFVYPTAEPLVDRNFLIEEEYLLIVELLNLAC